MSFAIKRFRWANYSVLVHLNFSNFRMCVCVNIKEDNGSGSSSNKQHVITF